jgi:hypothetical protein
MNKVVLLNILMNFVLGAVFIFLNSLALKNNLEETLISLALVYGIVIIIGNALYILMFCKN